MTTALRPSAARERLLRTASETFYAEGIRGVGVDRVISGAGVTRATFYRHFPGKDDLVVAYLTAVHSAVRERVGAVPATAERAAGWLRAFAEGIGDELCGRAFRGCPFINAAAEFPDPEHPVHRAVLAHRRWLDETVRRAFAVAGHPAPSDAARRFLMLRDGAMVAGYLADPRTARATLIAAVEDLLAAA
ncbi:TetR/AcrR family transcriptional regulator [Blastococcus sp. LR1]|uniref:TetR/AcrR family transcriptional regulator n=1 Tax=Blastococcus sp. LR1 TaxID=2877000 RepID=UPI001CCBAFFE|nr:TetR/AcrR family transcriptional regulator [Blastococcus sp. LR1]MCA0146956.1 TetR/AcrR family transcriptional regulator [Blastococcus sp. LR1]